jgi:O-antigen ligase
MKWVVRSIAAITGSLFVVVVLHKHTPHHVTSAAPTIKADKWTPSFSDRWQPALDLLDQRPLLFLPPPRKANGVRIMAA